MFCCVSKYVLQHIFYFDTLSKSLYLCKRKKVSFIYSTIWKHIPIEKLLNNLKCG